MREMGRVGPADVKAKEIGIGRGQVGKSEVEAWATRGKVNGQSSECTSDRRVIVSSGRYHWSEW